ncbi:MAG TPA: DNA repair protein RecO [Pseudolabrys sp.]|jgi:DNA repair protein RecO (recombination protein O)
MHWTDEGIVIGVKRHGEASAILELMTREHGRHLGLVRGGFGSRLKPVLQTGNSVSATWRARLDEHLGHYTVEAVNLRAASFFAASHAIYGVSHLAALMRLLPERDPHAGLYAEFDEVLDRLDDPAVVAPMAARFELQLLSELGFGLDLEQCASTGARADLIYVSPKSGRAVSREAGSPYADKMLRLPAFLRDRDVEPAGRDLADGFALTGFFLARHVLEPRGLTLSDERAHFIAAVLRGPRSAVAV